MLVLTRNYVITILLCCLVACPDSTSSFSIPQAITAPVSAQSLRSRPTIERRTRQPLFEKKGELEDGVVELADAEEIKTKTTLNVPFISQGEIDPETLNPDLSDPKQARVIIYIIISLLPVLFLIPLMLGSRELLPLDDFPPVPL